MAAGVGRKGGGDGEGRRTMKTMTRAIFFSGWRGSLTQNRGNERHSCLQSCHFEHFA